MGEAWGPKFVLYPKILAAIILRYAL